MNKNYNVEDGLWGVSLWLPKLKPLQHLVVEYLSTTDQSGPFHDLDGVIYGGADTYYTNGVYPDGWTLYDMTIGNPWLTSPKYNTNGERGVINTLVRLYYVAATGRCGNLNYQANVAYSINYGTNYQLYYPGRKQLSWYVDTWKRLSFRQPCSLHIGFSGDRGSMYGDNLALLLGISWEGFLTY